MCKMKHNFFIGLTLFISCYTYADLPLTVENLISDKGKITLESSLIYGNSKSKDMQAVSSVPVQVGVNAYINLPTEFASSELQTDYLVANIGAKYGISQKADLGMRINGVYQTKIILISIANRNIIVQI